MSRSLLLTLSGESELTAASRGIPAIMQRDGEINNNNYTRTEQESVNQVRRQWAAALRGRTEGLPMEEEEEESAAAADIAAWRRGRETRTLGLGVGRGAKRAEEAATGAAAWR